MASLRAAKICQRSKATRPAMSQLFELQSRHVQCEVICPWCDTAVEDDWHAFVGSTVARES